ncbi:hypothetical protein PENSPDRAFT_648619 [Peniophora sp. CONT]|nr:hypothetical protein PENSPDRAFT_648619 [Peniophora sp. CONT]
MTVPISSSVNSAMCPTSSSSTMRSHRGNRPSLPQSKYCHICPARFTRSTHLNRHLRTHTNERSYCCDTCQAEFTRSDLLTRHRRSCGDPANENRSRRKSCQACAESKVKCDLGEPCAKCVSRRKECTYLNDPKTSLEKKAASLARKQKKLAAAQRDYPDSEASSSPPPFSPLEASDLSSPHDLNHFDRTSSSSSLSSMTQSVRDLASGLEFSYATDSLFLPLDVEVPCLDVDIMGGLAPDPDVEGLDDALTRLMTGQAPAVDAPTVADHMAVNYFAPTAFEGWFDGDVPSPSLTSMATTASYMADPLAGPSIDLTSPQYFESPVLWPSQAPPFPSPSISSNLATEGISADVLHSATSQHYLYMFETAFLSHLPLLHLPTCSLDGKPPILIRAMQACGALFVDTQEASDFVSDTLNKTRDQLLQLMTKASNDFAQQLDLIIAGLLLQALDLQRSSFDKCASSNIYHGVLIMMIQRCGLVSRCSQYRPPALKEVNQPYVERAWKDWAMHETIKRTLYIAHIHDTFQCVFYSLPPSFPRNEMNLPVDEDLWRAGSAEDWFNLLQRPSPYGEISARLSGFSAQNARSVLGSMHFMPIQLPLSTFAHLILIHSLLSDIYTPYTVSAVGSTQTDTLTLHNALHTWLHSWRHAPDIAVNIGRPETRFYQNALPYYWLAQVTLLVGAQAPRFYTLAADVRYKVVTQWVEHIQGVVRHGEQVSTSLWFELMTAAESLESWDTDASSNDNFSFYNF